MLLLMAGALFSCAVANPEHRPRLVNENMDRADRHKSQGELQEAAEIYSVVLLSDPTNQIAANKLKELGLQARAVVTPTTLGVNRALGLDRRSLGLAIALYPFNRIMDVADLVSLQGGLEGGLLFDVHATRMLGAGLGGGGGMQFGWWQKRNLGFGVGHVGEFALGPVAYATEGFARTGTAGALSSSFSLAGMNHPYARAFQRNYDYYAIGGRVIALAVGAGVEFHPIEFLDALGGFLLIDFLRDDIGQTRSLNLSLDDQAAMEGLINTVEPEELKRNLQVIQALNTEPAGTPLEPQPATADPISGAPASVVSTLPAPPVAAPPSSLPSNPLPLRSTPMQPARPAAAAPETSLTGTVIENVPAPDAAIPAVPLAR